jgi:hypothetical protein
MGRDGGALPQGGLEARPGKWREEDADEGGTSVPLGRWEVRKTIGVNSSVNNR